jgi:hypothetical protein
MKRRYFVIPLVILVGLLVFLIITGIRSAQDNMDVLAGTDYPVSYSFNKGIMTIKLSGRKTPDLHWEVQVSDENIVSVAQKGKERNGRAKYTITPIAPGTGRVNFVRSTEIAGEKVDVAIISVPLYVAEVNGGLSLSCLQNPYLIKGPEVIASDTSFPVILNNYITNEGKPDDAASANLKGHLVFAGGMSDWTLSDADGMVGYDTTTESDGTVIMTLKRTPEKGPAEAVNNKNFDLTLSSESLGITERINVIFRDDGEVKITRILSK